MTTYFEVLARMFVLHMSFAQYLLRTHIVVMLVPTVIGKTNFCAIYSYFISEDLGTEQTKTHQIIQILITYKSIDTERDVDQLILKGIAIKRRGYWKRSSAVMQAG